MGHSGTILQKLILLACPVLGRYRLQRPLEIVQRFDIESHLKKGEKPQCLSMRISTK